MVRGVAEGEAVSEGKLTEIRVGVSTSAPRRGSAEEILARGVEDARAGIGMVEERRKKAQTAAERDGKGHRGK
jgi:hypothetical protein